jgi:ATP-dependent protease ClpP protease subunit
MRKWYRFQNAVDDASTVELHIYGDIGKSWWDDDAVSAKQFIDDLKAVAKTVTNIVVRVNSFGGSVYDAVAIANALRDQRVKGRTVTTIVDGIAASAASIVIMAGSAVRIADNGMVMVHNPLTCACGNSKDFRKLADDLDSVRGSILATYKWHSSLSDDELVALMDNETWMDADAAIANGFATEKIEGLPAAAKLDSRLVAELTVPEKFQARVQDLIERPAQDPAPADSADVLRRCAEAELDIPFAQTLIAAKASPADVAVKVSAEKDRRVAAKSRAAEVDALCATAKLPSLAAGYIASAMPMDVIKVHLTTITAAVDSHTQIDGGLDPNAGAQAGGTTWKHAFARANRRGRAN